MIANLSSQSRVTLAQIATGVDKTSPRVYATCIGLRNGKACITDGFGLLQWESDVLADLDCTLGTDLFERPVKFPQWEAVIAPDKDATAVDIQIDALKAITACFKAVKNAPLFMTIDPRGAPKIEFMPPTLSFNLAILNRYMKAVPKTCRLVSATAQGERLMLNYSHGFLVLIVAVAPSAAK